MKRVTIYDVAQEAHVSLATVSRVINGSEVVKEPTRIKVEEAIERLGYKPNAIAQGLALSKTTTIGVVIPEASDPFIGQVINGITGVAKMKMYNYNIILHTISEGITDLNDIIENIIRSRVDGVVIYNDKSLNNKVDTLSKYNIPIVMIGSKMSGPSVSSVYIDIEQAIFELVTSYLDRGIDDIAVLEDRKNQLYSNLILAGAKKAFEAKGLVYDNYLKISNDDHIITTTYKFLKNYFKDHKHSLIIANRDTQAMAVVNACYENNLRVPDDVEVVCVLDTKYTSMIRPEISGFSMMPYDIGAVSMRIMTKMLNGEKLDYTEYKQSYVYVERKSTK